MWCTCPPKNATHLALDRFNGYTVQFYPSTTASPNLVTILESIPTLRQLAFQQRSAAENNGILRIFQKTAVRSQLYQDGVLLTQPELDGNEIF